MNIDLRNVSAEFEKAVDLVKKEQGLKTNISAVEHMVKQYHKNEKLIEDYELKNSTLKRAKDMAEEKLKHFKNAINTLTFLANEK